MSKGGDIPALVHFMVRPWGAGSLAEYVVHMGADVPEWLPKILTAGKSAVDAAGDKIVGDEHHEEA